MTGVSLQMQWPLTSQSHGSVSQRDQLVFGYGSKFMPQVDRICAMTNENIRRQKYDLPVEPILRPQILTPAL
jgi:hypothetical protein